MNNLNAKTYPFYTCSLLWLRFFPQRWFHSWHQPLRDFTEAERYDAFYSDVFSFPIQEQTIKINMTITRTHIHFMISLHWKFCRIVNLKKIMASSDVRSYCSDVWVGLKWCAPIYSPVFSLASKIVCSISIFHGLYEQSRTQQATYLWYLFTILELADFSVYVDYSMYRNPHGTNLCEIL